MRTLILAILWIAVPAHAFVENVTHGYSSCIACHFSPAGGGILTDYGRSLSRELMSTWGAEGIEGPFFGFLENTEHVKYGGDIRGIQTYLENSRVKQGRLFMMQQNLEVAVKAGKAWLVGTVGTHEGPIGTPERGQFLSERHYLLWELSEATRLRVGKFRRDFGIYDPNHTRVTKAPLGFGPNSETYNMEFSQVEENFEVFVTAGLGRLDLPRAVSSERSLGLTYARNFWGDTKAGASLLVGESENQRRSLAGVFAINPLGEHGELKTEIDFQRSNLRSQPARNSELAAAAISASYTPIKGFRPYVFFEYLQVDLSRASTRQNSPGVGVQWLPIPHIELQAEFKHQTLESFPERANESGWLLLHLYL